jgi:hypothetical protein
MRPFRPPRSLATSDEPRTAAELVDRVQIDWAALEYAVASLSEAQLTAPGPEGWSVKDHLMHVGDWERAVTAVLRRRPQYEGFGLNAATYAGLDDDLDGLNDVLYRRSKAVSIAEVHARRRRAHAEVLDALATLTDADIQKTIAEYTADPTDTRPLLTKIACDTYAHYEEHTRWIKELLTSR